MLVQLANYHNISVPIPAEAQSRQEDPGGDQAYEKLAEEYGKGTQELFVSLETATGGGRLGGQGRAVLGRLSIMISRYTGKERSSIQHHWGFQYNLVSIRAEAQSRQENPWEYQSSKVLDLCKNMSSRGEKILIE